MARRKNAERWGPWLWTGPYGVRVKEDGDGNLVAEAFAYDESRLLHKGRRQSR